MIYLLGFRCQLAHWRIRDPLLVTGEIVSCSGATVYLPWYLLWQWHVRP